MKGNVFMFFVTKLNENRMFSEVKTFFNCMLAEDDTEDICEELNTEIMSNHVKNQILNTPNNYIQTNYFEHRD